MQVSKEVAQENGSILSEEMGAELCDPSLLDTIHVAPFSSCRRGRESAEWCDIGEVSPVR